MKKILLLAIFIISLGATMIFLLKDTMKNSIKDNMKSYIYECFNDDDTISCLAIASLIFFGKEQLNKSLEKEIDNIYKNCDNNSSKDCYTIGIILKSPNTHQFFKKACRLGHDEACKIIYEK